MRPQLKKNALLVRLFFIGSTYKNWFKVLFWGKISVAHLLGILLCPDVCLWYLTSFPGDIGGWNQLCLFLGCSLFLKFKNDAKAETPVLWPPHAKSWLIGKDWCWEGLGAEGEGDDRGWDGWMASLTRWTWVSVNSGSWWWIGRPGVLRFMRSQRVGHDWVTDLIW